MTCRMVNSRQSERVLLSDDLESGRNWCARPGVSPCHGLVLLDPVSLAAPRGAAASSVAPSPAWGQPLGRSVLHAQAVG